MNPEVMRKLRKDKGLSLKQLAEKTDISFSAIGMYERGEAAPSSEKFQKIAEVLGVSMEKLLGKTTIPIGDLDSTALEEISKNKAIEIIAKQQDSIACQQELIVAQQKTIGKLVDILGKQ